MSTVIKSISVSLEFEELAKKNNISWSEASRVGMSVLLADKGIREYDNNLNLYRKMNLFRMKAEESLHRIYELEDQIKEMSKNVK